VMDKKTHLPKFIEGAENKCISCGHCVAVCPTAALSLPSMPAEACLPLDKDWRVSPKNLEHFLKGRRSIRLYKEDIVERSIIEKLIDTARYAPSGINRQPVCWAVVYDKEKVKQLSALVIEWMRSLIKKNSALAEAFRVENIIKMYEKGADPITRGAPHIIIAYALKYDMTASQSCTIALTYLELMAASFGLGACWAGYVSMAINMLEQVRESIGLSKKTSAFGAMMIGYPKYNYSRIPLRNNPHILWR
jgi:nitroreductase